MCFARRISWDDALEELEEQVTVGTICNAARCPLAKSNHALLPVTYGATSKSAYFLSQIVLMKLTQDVTDLHSDPSELHYDSESTYVTLE